MPSFELAPDRLEHAHRLEANGLMKRDARLVGQRDACIGVAITPFHERCEQIDVEPAADSLAMPTRSDIGGGLHGPSVGSTLPMRRGVCIAYALTPAFGE